MLDLSRLVNCRLSAAPGTTESFTVDVQPKDFKRVRDAMDAGERVTLGTPSLFTVTSLNATVLHVTSVRMTVSLTSIPVPLGFKIESAEPLGHMPQLPIVKTPVDRIVTVQEQQESAELTIGMIESAIKAHYGLDGFTITFETETYDADPYNSGPSGAGRLAARVTGAKATRTSPATA